MTIVLRRNEGLELNLVEYRETVTLPELKCLAAFATAQPLYMKSDSLNVILPGAAFAVDQATLDALFELYRELYATLSFEMLRRSAWVCLSPEAAPALAHWLSGDARQGMSSAVRGFDSMAEAGEWLLLNPAESAAAERGEGFAHVKSFTDPARDASVAGLSR